MDTWGIPAPVFLATYATLAAALGAWTLVDHRSGARPIGSEPLDMYEAAFLAGGEQRVAAIALWSLASRGVIVATDLGEVALATPVPFGLHPVERAVADAVQPSPVPVTSVPVRLRRTVTMLDLRAGLHTRALERELFGRRGVVVRTAATALLAAVGLARFAVEEIGQRPTELVGLLAVGTCFIGAFSVAVPRVTPRGVAALAAMRQEHLNLHPAWPATATGERSDPLLAAALFGPEALWRDDARLASRLALPRTVESVSGDVGSNGEDFDVGSSDVSSGSSD